MRSDEVKKTERRIEGGYFDREKLNSFPCFSAIGLL
jgi:hypothetical protein